MGKAWKDSGEVLGEERWVCTEGVGAKHSIEADAAWPCCRRKEFPRITLPVLILHGTNDKATKPSGSQLFYDTAGSRDKTLKLYEGHAHDLLNDLDKEKVMGDIRAWINTRLGAA